MKFFVFLKRRFLKKMYNLLYMVSNSPLRVFLTLCQCILDFKTILVFFQQKLIGYFIFRNWKQENPDPSKIAMNPLLLHKCSWDSIHWFERLIFGW